MRRTAFTSLSLSLFSLLLAASTLHAQNWHTGPCGDDEGNTHNNSWFGGHARVCELRRATVPLVNGQVAVKGENGGIEVIGQDRTDIEIEARVIAQAGSRDDAEALLKQVHIETGGVIHADGPSSSGGWFSNKSWYVNYKLLVPRSVAARLQTENGGIDLRHLDGRLRAETTNGGLTLEDLAGDVRATTTNGGVNATLSGPTWHGAGLYAQSVNGGVTVTAPSGYSAHLVASTVNGGIDVQFPITVQGRIHNSIDTNIGNGGPTIQFVTTNGGVSLTRE